MSIGAYLAGIASLALIVVPWAVAGPIVSRRLHSHASLAGRALAGVVVALAGLVVVSELVGAFGGFHRVVLGVASLLSAAIAVTIARRRPVSTSSAQHQVPDGRRFDVVVAFGAATMATAQSLAGVAASYRTGITQIESLHYHLTHAAYFVQTGTDWRPHEVSASSDAAFHPLNVELLHALGMVSLRSDFLSLFIDVGLLWLALLAAWVAGERAGAGAVSVCGVALLCVAFPLGGVAGGTALNDIGVIAFVLAAAALVPAVDDNGPPSSGQIVPAGLALGLALGTKLSTPGVVAGLLLGWWWLWRGQGWRARAASLIGSTVLTGVFWYVRDWWFFGNPLPGISLEIGGHGLAKVPTPAADGTEFSVAHYLSKPSIVHHWFVPALHVDFGPLWPLILLVPAAGVVLAVRPGRAHVDRALAFAAALAFLSYLLTPTGAQGYVNQPILFGSNVRYAVPALVLGVVCLARDPWIARRRVVPLGLIALSVVELANRRFWPADRVGTGIVAAAVIAVLAVAAVVVVRRSHRVVVAVGVGGILVAVVVGKPAESHYLNNRYAATSPARAALFGKSRQLAGDRVGAVGLPLVYPFYGPSFADHAEYVGDPGPHHQFNDYTTCQGWLGALATDRINAVVVMPVPGGDSYARFSRWTVEGGGTPLITNSAGSIYRLPTTPSPVACR